jgi:uncharacterized membrane protein YvbJ
MPLINCSECNHEVSSKAESCPKCGAPISTARETQAAGAAIKTVQETSKKFKLQSLISVVLIIIGFVWMLNLSQNSASEPSPIPGILIFVGFFWYIVNRFRIWWHHK